jgi:hypothetical protein
MNNIDLAKTLHQIWNTGNLALIESVYARDFLAHWQAPRDPDSADRYNHTIASPEARQVDLMPVAKRTSK